MDSHIERTSDLAKAVHVLRQQGMTVSFPMQIAEGEIIFALGEDFTLTANQILEQRRLATLPRPPALSNDISPSTRKRSVFSCAALQCS